MCKKAKTKKNQLQDNKCQEKPSFKFHPETNVSYRVWGKTLKQSKTKFLLEQSELIAENEQKECRW